MKHVIAAIAIGLVAGGIFYGIKAVAGAAASLMAGAQ